MILAPFKVNGCMDTCFKYCISTLHSKYIFFSFPFFLNIHQSGNTWPQCTVIFTPYSSTLFSLVQVYASELVDSISVFLSAAD